MLVIAAMPVTTSSKGVQSIETVLWTTPRHLETGFTTIQVSPKHFVITVNDPHPLLEEAISRYLGGSFFPYAASEVSCLSMKF